MLCVWVLLLALLSTASCKLVVQELDCSSNCCSTEACMAPPTDEASLTKCLNTLSTACNVVVKALLGLEKGDWCQTADSRSFGVNFGNLDVWEFNNESSLSISDSHLTAACSLDLHIGPPPPSGDCPVPQELVKSIPVSATSSGANVLVTPELPEAMAFVYSKTSYWYFAPSSLSPAQCSVSFSEKSQIHVPLTKHTTGYESGVHRAWVPALAIASLISSFA